MSDTLMTHSISASTKNNAAKFSHNSLQGHYHSLAEIAYAADANMIRWSMTVGTLMDSNSVAARYGASNILKKPINSVGVVVNDNSNFLIISDMHIPYHHPDSFDFLEAVTYAYDCKTILNVGDIVDNHSGSYHESEPDALSAEDEYTQAIKYCQELQGIFPKMVISVGNHDLITQRKLKTCGLPASIARDYNQLYELKDTWDWKDKYFFDSKEGQPVLVPMVLNKKGRWNGRV